MVKALIADDEKMIRDGIKAMVNWGEFGIDHVDMAQDGLEAYSKALANTPDIIITDIKMPGLSGLELISKLKAQGSKARFIVLSGYAEFKFAKKAMMDGVKHYLLKPTSVDEITQVLRQVVADLDESLRSQHFIENLKQQFLISMPSIKEQFLRDCVLHRFYSESEWLHYKELLGIDSNRKVRLIVAQLEGSFEYLEVFALKNIYEYTIPQELILLSTIMGNKLLFLLGASDEEEVVALAAKAKEAFMVYYKMDVTTFIGAQTTFDHIHMEYKHALQGMGMRFYLGEGSIITSKDVSLGSKIQLEDIEYELQNIVCSVKVGNVQEAAAGIHQFFEQLQTSQCDVQEALSYCMEVLVAVSRQASEHGRNASIRDLAPVLSMSNLEEIRTFTQQFTERIAVMNREALLRKHSECVTKMLQLIEEHYQDNELSLTWISKQKLFMHSDYLGKLFKKETGDYFSQYVMQYRIEKAQMWLKADPEMKVYELAEKTGFGLNSQYFIKVFKKYTGKTPKEYKQGN